MKRWRLLLLAGLFLVALAFLLVPVGPREPVHADKTLTRWINEANDVGIFEQDAETLNAMAAFGTNVVPFLLHEFTRPISPRWQGIVAWVNELPWRPVRVRDPAERMRVAGRGLYLLGTNAIPAIPVLISCLADAARGEFAADALREIGPAAVPQLAAALNHTNNPALVREASNTLYRIAPASLPGSGR